MFPGFVLKKCVLGLLVFPGSNLPFSWQKPAFFHPPHVFPERQAPPVASELPATGSRGVVRGPQRPTCGTLKPPRTPLLGVQNKKKMDVHHVPPWKIYEDIAIYWGSLTKSPLYCVYIYISYSCTKHQSFLEGSDWLYPRCMDLGDRRIIPTWRAFCRNGLCAQIVQGWAWQLVVSRVSQMGLSENRVPFRHTQISCDGSLYPIIPTICSLQ